jgi:signal transduction histidine kinase
MTSHQHNHLLVVLSVLIAIFASYTALDLANAVTSARGKARLAWLAGGSVAMGVGIWSMHFIAMLAFSIAGIPIAYDIPTLLLSVAVANLVTNAARYAAGKPVGISVRRDGNKAALEVKDQGIGIAEENQKRIFQRFERAGPVAETGGLGLGLYIVRSIVEMHGGSIELHSALGRGSTFVMRLPLGGSAD